MFPAVGMPHALWERQGPRELTTVAMHEVEGKDGAPQSWERVTTVYDAVSYTHLVLAELARREGLSGLAEKASRPQD